MDPKQQPTEESTQPQQPLPPQQPEPPVVNDVSSPAGQAPATPGTNPPATAPEQQPQQPPSTDQIKTPPPSEPEQAKQAANDTSQPNAQAPVTSMLGGAQAQQSSAKGPHKTGNNPEKETQEVKEKPSQKPDKKSTKSASSKPKSNKPVAFILLAVVTALVLMGLAVLSYMGQADEDVDRSTTAPVSQTQQTTEDDSAATEQINQLQSKVDNLSEELAEAEQELNALDENVDEITDEPVTPDSSDNQETTN